MVKWGLKYLLKLFRELSNFGGNKNTYYYDIIG